MRGVILAEFLASYGTARTLHVVESADYPDEVELRLVGRNGGFQGSITLPRATAEKLGEELVKLYGD
jgi:hypothetical protein